MPQPSPAEEPPQSSTDVMFQGILAFLLPFFLNPAFGDAHAAGMTVIHLIESFNAATPRELDLAGQIAILGSAAMDSLQRSMDPALPDSKILSYRASAASLTRSAARLQRTLDALQKSRGPGHQPIRAYAQQRVPAGQPAPEAASSRTNHPAKPVPSPAPAAPIPPKAARPPAGNPTLPDPVIANMKLDAHTAIKALQTRNASLMSVAFPVIPDPAMAARAAAQAAMASVRYKSATSPG